MPQKLILPSLLSAPYWNMGQAIAPLEEAGMQVLHFDVMDGHFVPNITIGPLIIKSLSPHVRGIFDVHLMVTNPETQIEWFSLPKVRSITVHIEACGDASSVMNKIRKNEQGTGVTLRPATPLEIILPVLEEVDQVLVMTVDPGFAGQAFMPEMLPRIEALARLREQKGLNFIIQVDGGINEETVRLARDAGADEFVAGSAVFSRPDPVLAFRQLTEIIL